MLTCLALKEGMVLSNLCCLTQISSIHSVNTLHANVAESLQHCQKRQKLRGVLALILPTSPFQLCMSVFLSPCYRPEMIHPLSRKLSFCLPHEASLNCNNTNEGGKQHNRVSGFAQCLLKRQDHVLYWRRKCCCTASAIRAQKWQTVSLAPSNISVLLLLRKCRRPSLLVQLPALGTTMLWSLRRR